MCEDGDKNNLEGDTKNFCEPCQEYCDGNIAIYYCPQCCTNYCHECYDKEHKLKRRKEDHDKIQTPRQTCPQHKLTLEYHNKAKNVFMCCMCIKEMSPGDFVANNVEPIDGIASVLRIKLAEKVAKINLLSNTIRNKIETCSFNISTSIEEARNEVRRFFNALGLLLVKQEESFQHQLTNLFEAAHSKPFLSEMNHFLSAIEALSLQGRALLSGDSLVIAKEFDAISSEIDETLDTKMVENFTSTKLNISVNVHRHLLEMIRHPGYITSTFSPELPCGDQSNSRGVSVCNIDPSNKKTDEISSIPAICSPPDSLPEDDGNTPYSLVPAFSCNSSPLYFQSDDNSSLRPLAANSVGDESLTDDNREVCSCSEEGVDSAVQKTEKSPPVNSSSSEDEVSLKDRKSTKRKIIASEFLTYSRKTRRQEASKELIRCDMMLTELWACNDSFPFVRPVDAKKVPHYYEIIDKPMDLGKIKSNLHSVSYDSVYDFLSDMKLMFDNCYKFNTPESPIYESGNHLEQLFVKLLHDNFPFIYYESSAHQSPPPSLVPTSSSTSNAVTVRGS